MVLGRLRAEREAEKRAEKRSLVESTIQPPSEKKRRIDPQVETTPESEFITVDRASSSVELKEVVQSAPAAPFIPLEETEDYQAIIEHLGDDLPIPSPALFIEIESNAASTDTEPLHP